MSQPADSPDSQPTPAEQPADAAHAGTPHYGTFGDPANVPATPEHHPNRPGGRCGANRRRAEAAGEDSFDDS